MAQLSFARRRAIITASTVAFAAAVVSIWYLSAQQSDFGSYLESHSGFGSPSQTNVALRPDVAKQAAPPDIRARPQQAVATQKFKADAKQVTASTLANVKAALEEIEKANATTILDKEFPGGFITVVRVTPPTPAQEAVIYDQLSKGQQQLSDNLPAEEDLSNAFMKVNIRYVSYPKKIKVLKVTVPKDASLNVKLLEFYVDDESLCLPDDDGRLVMPASKDAIVHIDEDYGGENSWAGKRYSHLISIDR